MMENLLLSLKSVHIPWLSPDLITLAMDMILAIVCGVGLFLLLLLLPCFKGNPSSPTPKKKKKLRKKRHFKNRKKRETLKACKDTREHLEEIHNLVSLLSCYLGQLHHTRSFQHFLKGGALSEIFNSESTTSPPSARYYEDDTFSSTMSSKVSPAPSPKALQPLDSTWPPVQMGSSVSTESHTSQSVSRPPEPLIALGEHLSCSPAHSSPHSHSPQPVVYFPPRPNSNLGLPLYNIIEVPPETTPQSCSPINGSRVPSPIPAFNSDILEMLEIVISKRAKLKACQEREHPLDSLGNMMKSLGGEQDTAMPEPLWNTKPEQLPDSQEYIFLGEQLQPKCSQLFWGLPFLHSESLVVPVRLSGHPLDLPSILFNGLSSYIPIQVQPNIQPQLFPSQPLLHHLVQSQALTPPVAETQAHAHLPSCTPPMLPCHSSPVSSPTTQEGNKCMIPPVIQQLECHLLKKHKESQRALPPAVKQSLKVFNHNEGSPDQRHFVNFPGDFISFEFQKKLEHHLQERFTQHCYRTQCMIQLSPDKLPGRGQADKSCQATQKAISDGPATAFPRWKKGPCLSRVVKEIDTESSEDALDSFTDLTESFLGSSSDSDYVCPMHSDKYRPENLLQIHANREWGQINAGKVPVTANQPRGVLDSSLSSFENSHSSLETEGTPGTSSPQATHFDAAARQLLEAHIKKLWVRHKWGLFLKVLKSLNQLTLKRAPPVSVSQEASQNVACKDVKPNPTAKGVEVPGEAFPRAPAKETGKTEGAAAPTALPSPLLECLRRIICSYAQAPTEGAPLEQEGGPPSQPKPYSLVGRSWHRDIAPRSEASSVEPITSPQTDRSESPKTESLCHSVSIREVFVESTPGRTDEFREMAEDEEEEPNYVTDVDSSHLNLRSLEVLRATQTALPASRISKHQEPGLQGQAESSGPSQSPPLDVILQDCETDALLQNCGPEVLFSAHMLPSRSSLGSSRNFSGSSTSICNPCLALPNGGDVPKQQESETSEQQDPWYSQMFSEPDKEESLERPRIRIQEVKTEETEPSHSQKPSSPAQVRRPSTTRKRSCLPEPEKEQPPPESQFFGNRIRSFFMSFFPGKGKSQADSPQKSKIQSTSTQTQDLPTSNTFESSELSETQTLISNVARILEEKVGCQHERSLSKKTVHKEFQAPIERHSHYHAASYLEQCPVRNSKVCHHQRSPIGHRHPVSDRVSYWDSRGTPLLPRRPVSLANSPCQQRRTGTNISGHHVHCPRHCQVAGVLCGHTCHPSHVVSCGVYFPQDNFQPMSSNTIVFI
ncbi:spermatogenesis-associated protein 31E1-like isoform X1 [Dipodomys merriami]|uniref:spermatogenesis-associated protein 31E1-like isoform X1 n=1 Tax=Dipodomys merriami TaxID=94247 RepID=UPI0038559788